MAGHRVAPCSRGTIFRSEEEVQLQRIQRLPGHKPCPKRLDASCSTTPVGRYVRRRSCWRWARLDTSSRHAPVIPAINSRCLWAAEYSEKQKDAEAPRALTFVHPRPAVLLLDTRAQPELWVSRLGAEAALALACLISGSWMDGRAAAAAAAGAGCCLSCRAWLL